MMRAADLVGCALDGRYELLGLLGEGAFGWVYEGCDRRLARSVAVKVIKPWWAEDDAWVDRFEREAQMLARVNDAGIVQIFDIGRADEGPYYVAELVHGESLEQRLRRGAVAPTDARTLAEQLARALGSAHARGIVHCDVKPGNVLIAADGGVKVGDFSVARLAEGTSQALAGTVAGTPRYMSPEQARGEQATPATDVYSAGVVLYEMLAGKPPFTGGSAVELALRHLQDAPPPLPRGIPKELAELVEKSLAKRPGRRFRDGSAMAAALRECAPAVAASAQVAHVAHAGVCEAEPQEADSAPEAAATVDLAPPPTRVAPRPRGRSRAAPPARGGPGAAPWPFLRRRAALLAVVLILAVGALAAFRLGGAGASTTVPELRGLPVGGVDARAKRTHVRPLFSRRYAQALAGVAVAQAPAPGRRVSYGSTVHVVLSAGPPPVRVPAVVGLSSASASAQLAHAGLHDAVTLVPGTGATANSVLRQVPAPPATIPRGSTVSLHVAEAARWRALLSFTGVDSGTSAAVSIRGSRWRVSYSMGYRGTCLLLVTCLGPSAQARDLRTDQAFGEFELGDGSGQTHTFNSGPGVYRVEVSGGSDAAAWSMTIEDFY